MFSRHLTHFHVEYAMLHFIVTRLSLCFVRSAVLVIIIMSINVSMYMHEIKEQFASRMICIKLTNFKF